MTPDRNYVAKVMWESKIGAAEAYGSAAMAYGSAGMIRQSTPREWAHYKGLAGIRQLYLDGYIKVEMYEELLGYLDENDLVIPEVGVTPTRSQYAARWIVAGLLLVIIGIAGILLGWF